MRAGVTNFQQIQKCGQRVHLAVSFSRSQTLGRSALGKGYHVSEQNVQRAVKTALRKAAVRKNGSCHSRSLDMYPDRRV
jgi:hypothetical protein